MYSFGEESDIIVIFLLLKMSRGKTYIKTSAIHGVGVFAKKNLKKGEIAFIMRGKIVFVLEKTKKDALSNPNRIGLEKNMWLDPNPPALFINHSCDPNLGMRGKFLFVALRNIKKGEELTFDYSISEDSLWEMRCGCGKERCRGVIRGIRFLPKDFFEKYLPYVPKYFQDIYRKDFVQKK